jgi:hypothetical protein
MQRNRESAALSRKRRKEKMESLEVQLDQVVKSSSEMRAKFEQLVKENAKLKEENNKVCFFFQSGVAVVKPSLTLAIHFVASRHAAVN